jgi:hypothetical protein
MSEDALKDKHANLTGEVVEGQKDTKSRKQELELSHIADQNSGINSADSSASRKGMVLPFAPLSISFNDVRYSVDMPEVILLRTTTSA